MTIECLKDLICRYESCASLIGAKLVSAIKYGEDSDYSHSILRMIKAQIGALKRHLCKMEYAEYRFSVTKIETTVTSCMNITGIFETLDAVCTDCGC